MPEVSFSPPRFSPEATLSSLFALLLGGASMFVGNPLLSSVLFTAACIAVAFFIVRQIHWSIYVRIVLILTLSLFSAFLTSVMYKQKYENDLRSRFGSLDPDDKPTNFQCASAPEAVGSIWAGSNILTVIGIRYKAIVFDDEPIVEVSIDNNKLVINKLIVKNSSGDLLLKIDSDNFELYSESILEHPNGELSALRVYNKNYKEAVYIYFINKNHIFLTANLSNATGRRLIISPSEVETLSPSNSVKLSHGSIRQSCLTSIVFKNGGITIQ